MRDVVVEPICQSRGRRFIDNAQHLEPSNPAGIFGRLALCIVEVCRYRNDRLTDWFTKERLGIEFEFLEHHCRNLGDRIVPSRQRDVDITVFCTDQMVRHHGGIGLDIRICVFSPEEALRREHRLLRVDDCLALGNLTYQAFARFAKCNDRRCQTHAFGVGDNGGFAAFHHRHNRIGGAQIDSYDFRHAFLVIRLQKTQMHRCAPAPCQITWTFGRP